MGSDDRGGTSFCARTGHARNAVSRARRSCSKRLCSAAAYVSFDRSPDSVFRIATSAFATSLGISLRRLSRRRAIRYRIASKRLALSAPSRPTSEDKPSSVLRTCSSVGLRVVRARCSGCASSLGTDGAPASSVGAGGTSAVTGGGISSIIFGSVGFSNSSFFAGSTGFGSSTVSTFVIGAGTTGGWTVLSAVRVRRMRVLPSHVSTASYNAF